MLGLLIFSPLFLSVDGDPYRAYEVASIGLLFMLIKIFKMGNVKLCFKFGIPYIIGIAVLTIIQPALLESAGLFFNIKIATTLIACFVPLLALSNCDVKEAANEVKFITKALNFVFIIAIVSLVFSYTTGIGEVYDEGLNRRAFAWLGDAFSPVMAFFFYYFTFRNKLISAAIAALCIIVIMKAKMCIIMVALGYLAYLFIISKSVSTLRRLCLYIAIVCSVSIGVILFITAQDYLTKDTNSISLTGNTRLLSLEAGLAFFRSSPWLGVGANQTFTLLNSGFDIEALDNYDKNNPFFEINQVHNSFIRVLAELGIGGFLLFVGFCIAIISESYAVLVKTYPLPQSDLRAILMACGLWLISFVLFYQTVGWFEPGHPQLAWLVCFLTLMNFSIKVEKL